MKTFSTAWANALAAGGGHDVGAVKILAATPFLVWGGIGELQLSDNGGPLETYVGIGARGLIRSTASQLGGGEQSLELSLSGVEPNVLNLIDASDVRGAAVVIWRLGFDSACANLLDAQVYARGRVDRLGRQERAGGEASIRCTVTTAARGSGRATGRTRSDADHRLVDAADGAFKRVTQAGEIVMAWGGKPPARAITALPNAEFLRGVASNIANRTV